MTRCIDIHLHLGRSRDGASLSFAEIRKAFQRFPVHRGILFAIDEPNPGPSYRRVNDKVYRAFQKDKRFVGACRINPHNLQVACNEIVRCRKKGFRAVKLHPRSEDFHPKNLGALFDFIETQNLPVILHTAHEIHCHPITWKGIFLRHKKISFILTHAGKDGYRQAAEISRRCPNVFLETSTLSLWRTSVVLKKVGPRKMLFGSDMPYSHIGIEQQKYNLILGQNRSAKKKIFHENAERIFGGF